jgi:hypothetical protein
MELFKSAPPFEGAKGGRLFFQPVAIPATQSGASIRGIAGSIIELVGVYCEINTDATAVSRKMSIAWGFPSVRFGYVTSNAGATATSTFIGYMGAFSAADLSIDNVLRVPLPPIFIPDQGIITFGWSNFAGGDVANNLLFTYRQWLTP